MKKRFKTKITFLVLLVGLSIFLLPGYSRANSGQIYISPSSSSVQNGNNVTVSLRINPGTTVNAVQATVSYDQSALQFVSTTLGAFPLCAQDSGGGGTVTLACAYTGGSPPSSDSLIATIVFKALASSGSTALQLSGANAANNGTYTNPSTANATVNFTSPSAPTPSSGSSTSKSSSSKTSSKITIPTATATTPTATTTPSTTTPTATSTTPTFDTTFKSLQFSQAAIDISSNVPAQLAVIYGTSSNQLNTSTPFSALGTTSLTSFNSPLTPGTTYYYRVIAKNASGNVIQSAIKSFTTKGYTLEVTVFDGANHAITDKAVTLHSKAMTLKTNNDGVVTFTNVAPGLHHLEYSGGSKSYSGDLYVENNVVTKNGTQTATPQHVAVILAGYLPSKKGFLPMAGLGLVVLLIIGGTTGLIMRRRLPKAGGPTSEAQSPTAPTAPPANDTSPWPAAVITPSPGNPTPIVEPTESPASIEEAPQTEALEPEETDGIVTPPDSQNQGLA